MIAGLGGSLSVLNDRRARPRRPAQYTISRSIEFLVALVIGGAATIFGPVLGSLFIVFVPELSSDVNAELSRVHLRGRAHRPDAVLPGGILGGLRQLEASVLRRSGRDGPRRKVRSGAGSDRRHPRSG